MMHQFKRRLACLVCALALLAASLPTAFAAPSAPADPAVQTLSASDVKAMQQADDAVAALTGSADLFCADCGTQYFRT